MSINCLKMTIDSLKIYPVEVNSLEIVVGVANNNRHFFAHSCQMNFTRDGKIGTPAPFLVQLKVQRFIWYNKIFFSFGCIYKLFLDFILVNVEKNYS